MVIYRYMSNWKLVAAQLILSIAVLKFMPALQMVIVTLMIIFIGARFNADSDRLFR
ncbi:hypothetical protein [Lentilactobacillus buchneri]|uniref:Uncharacterized protein n=1 Tax=Lentilactobacillus buchneri subsp. silagei CD034 TaxID=1071400 RepID=J9W173_LENBU|nr:MULTISPECIES: hypothetical protein [Lentilactobacillus]MCC6100912.1 hypothetical protein [Lactobacillus sp.]AFR99426.1 hypothetical protein LBUCD034_0322 [Lentilactobacillus buchneri subsp. silagei CD034]MCV3743162.1 hypothetical protein [Lentilactobacillus hilgardii]BEJ53005.1 hypothetical protein Ltb232_11810 [Lentilactobacillus buchneri subsp. silagei]GED91366.1 hypothetical protein LBSG162_04710 [Lentilactobacillus buchneri subsp. silagei]